MAPTKTNQSSAKILIVVAKFNDMITRCLLTGAEETLKDAGLSSSTETVWVPGCFEIPAVASKAAKSGKYSAIITLGAVIRGETPHFDFVAGECARGVMDVTTATGVPVIFGVLTTNTVEQALNRSGIKYGNKGRDAALAAIDMIKIMGSL
jgi:6,7-dimethyl-8-ribityllumazine synthase